MVRGFAHESTDAQVPVEWYTPPSIFDRLGLVFDLDPCAAPAYDHVPAHTKYVLPTDGLTEPWNGTVWLNPPYGKQTGIWVERLAKHGDGIALVFARPDTAWFQRAYHTADIVCFVDKRIKFINGKTGRADGTPGAGSALIGWGNTAYTALINSGLGVCTRRIERNC